MRVATGDREFYKSNNLFESSVPKRLEEKVDIRISSNPPTHYTQAEIDKYTEIEPTEYIDASIGTTKWTYLIRHFKSRHPMSKIMLDRTELLDILIKDKDDKVTSIQTIAKKNGITDLNLVPIDPDKENRMTSSALSDEDPTSPLLSVPIPREKQDYLIVVHELAHPILELKIRDRYGESPKKYYTEDNDLSLMDSWEHMLITLVGRYRDSVNDVDRKLLQEAFERTRDSMLQSNTFERVRGSLARWELDTWAIALQLAHETGLTEFMQDYSEDISKMINYTAIYSRFHDLKLEDEARESTV